MKAPSRPPAPWIWAAAPAAISRCCSWKRRAPWVSERASSRAISSIPASLRAAGTTHAWAEVFVPGAGWITFDPTNRQMGGFNLIPVAVARDLSQAMPVSGTFIGAGGDLARLTVAVRVTHTSECAAA